jgi:hypothetical protein
LPRTIGTAQEAAKGSQVQVGEVMPMNEHQQKIIGIRPSKPKPTSTRTYIKLEMWVDEANFPDVYEALNDIGTFGHSFILQTGNKDWSVNLKALQR